MYVVSPVIEAVYFRVAGPPLIFAIRSFLSLLPGTVPENLSRWEIGYGAFRVTLGYACTDFSAMMLFAGLFGAVWWRLAKRGGILHGRTLTVLLAGILTLWVLNILRIALIVIIGSHAPAFALSLFHSAMGMVIFLLFFVLYMSVVMPFVRLRPERRGT